MTAHFRSSRASHTPRWTALALAATLVTGCSTLTDSKVDYKSTHQVAALDIPPDLTQLSKDPRYSVGAGAVTASGMQAAPKALAAVPATAPNQLADARFERAGAQRWLVVQRPPEQLWGPVNEFWKESGFVLAQADEKLGLMETEWAENRAKLPQDIIRSTIGKVFDSLYSTGERDKFRTRLERAADGSTEIYISHRGMVEVYTNDRKESTVWQPRASDPELEAEFLRRLLLKLGATKEQAQAATAAAPVSAAPRVAQIDNQPVLRLDDGFDRAWRRIGLALDRTGFTVVDRDRSQGVYFVRYVAAEAEGPESKSGFFSGWFGGKKDKADNAPVRYRLVVKAGTGAATTVSVQDANGQPERSASAQRILQVIADDLK